MAHSVSLPVNPVGQTRVQGQALQDAAAVPWYLWCAVAAVTSAMAGAHWDISWHRSIGRDAFLTPAHIAIYMCGVLAGLSCGYMILATTFGRLPELNAVSVKMWGFRGPLGAFISAWGGVAMLASAPFDNWWHGAYGLDVKVLSPPHVVLILGVFAVEMGTLMLTLAFMNRASGALRRTLEWLFLYVGAMILVLMLVLLFEYNFRSLYHSALFYRVMSMGLPAVLAGVGYASGRKWACTTAAGIYLAFMLALCWILPLFPAEPKLGPVYTEVHQFVPPPFPLLLIVPAFFLDLVRARGKEWSRWTQAVVGGTAFLVSFFAVEWPFGSFLMSPAAENWIFGSKYFDYMTPHNSLYYRNIFFPIEKTSGAFWTGMAWALVFAILTTWVGLAWGSWMRRVRR